MLADQQWDESFWTGAEVYDGDKRLPSQIVREASSVNLDWAKRVVFDCELEPFSMRVFAAKPVKTERGAARALSGDAPYVHEDAFKRVVLNTKTGFIDGITAGGGKYVGRGAFAPTVYADNADPWGMGAGQRERLGKREKPFKLMAAKEAAAFLASDLPEVPPLRLVEDGEVCSVIEGFYKYAHSPVSVSTIVMRYTLYKNAPYTDVDLRVLWSGSDKMLKLHIPAAFKGEYAGQIAYGRESFPQTGRECAAHSWVSYGNRSRAFALLNDGVYGSSCENGDIGATLLRGAVYAAHPIGERPLIPSGRASDRIDHGERFYRFRFIAGKATEISDALDREAQIFNERPFALHMFPSGAGSLPRPALKLSGGAVTLTAFKRARNGDGYIVRLFNGSAKECRAVLTAFGTETPLSFGKFEIKTLRYRNGTLTECVAAEI
jgi:alpha-mannosidase